MAVNKKKNRFLRGLIAIFTVIVRPCLFVRKTDAGTNTRADLEADAVMEPRSSFYEYY